MANWERWILSCLSLHPTGQPAATEALWTLCTGMALP